MRPRTVRRFYGFMALGAFLAAAFIFGVGVAKADRPSDYDSLFGPAICAALNAHPTDAQMDAVAVEMLHDGLTPTEAAQAIAITVTSRCPNQVPTVQHWAATKTPGISDVVLR
jgi:hypothetical protein